MTYTSTDSGGAAFCTGSIAWGQALPSNGFDNDVSRITENVLRRFSTDGPLTVLSEEQVDQQARLVQAWRTRQDVEISELCRDSVCDELNRWAFGPHSDVAIRVLNHLRSDPERGQLVIVEDEPNRRYRLVDLRTGDSREFESAEAAAGALLLDRVRSLGGE